jgi:hypothetical protein
MAPDVNLMTKVFVADGTTFPMPSDGFIASAVADFIAPTVSSSDGFDAVGLRTPEEIFDITGAAERGADIMLAAIDDYAQEHPGEPIVVFGYSQSTVSTALAKAVLAARKAAGEAIPEVTFVGIGVGNRPNGAIAERFNGVTIPFFHFTFNGAAPTDGGVPSVDIVRQYDGLSDFPEFPLNLIADLNALIGIVSVHALYGELVSLDPSSPKYVATQPVTHGDTTYYTIPNDHLPLLDPLRLIGVPEALLDIVEPTLKVIVEAGYDRSVPVWEPTPAQLIPVIDPATFTLQLAQGVVEGINNAFKIVGATMPGYQQISTALAAVEQMSAEVIGKPYKNIVRVINTYLNPFQAFAAVEGPIARVFDQVLIHLGVQSTLNKLIDPVLFPITHWLENTVLFPTKTPQPAPTSAVTAPEVAVSATSAKGGSSEGGQHVPAVQQGALEPVAASKADTEAPVALPLDVQAAGDTTAFSTKTSEPGPAKEVAASEVSVLEASVKDVPSQGGQHVPADQQGTLESFAASKADTEAPVAQALDAQASRDTMTSPTAKIGSVQRYTRQPRVTRSDRVADSATSPSAGETSSSVAASAATRPEAAADGFRAAQPNHRPTEHHGSQQRVSDRQR